MSCKCNKQKNNCGCQFNLTKHGACNPANITLDGRIISQLNWNEISVPEIVDIPEQKPDIEHIDEVFVNASVDCVKLIETPFAYTLYQRIATPAEITDVMNAVLLSVVNVQPVIDAANAIIALVLPDVPVVTAFENALAAVIAANTALTAALDTTLTTLSNATCLAASALALIVAPLQLAIETLIDALTLLANTALALVAELNIPGLDLLVEALTIAITTASGLLTTALAAIAASITALGTTTYFTMMPNEEGTCLTGRKLIVEGSLKQKIVYTGLVERQSVHSTHNTMPFTAYIIPYAKFDGIEMEENVEVLIDSATCTTEIINAFPFDPNQEIVVDLCEEFCVNAYVEDIFAYALDSRTVFKNITLFLKANAVESCV